MTDPTTAAFMVATHIVARYRVVVAHGTSTRKTAKKAANTSAAKKAAAKTRMTGKVGTKSTTTRKVRARKVGTSTTSRKWQPEQRARFVTEVAGGTRKAAALLDVAASQPSRWVTGASVPGPAQARMLVDLDHVLAHALLIWADERVARDWLTTPNAHLDGVRPVKWIRMHGTSEVVDAIRAEAAGAYA